jgi:hypothetical protein
MLDLHMRVCHARQEALVAGVDQDADGEGIDNGGAWKGFATATIINLLKVSAAKRVVKTSSQ